MLLCQYCNGVRIDDVHKKSSGRWEAHMRMLLRIGSLEHLRVVHCGQRRALVSLRHVP